MDPKTPPETNCDYTCKLCKTYMHDLLDSPPCSARDRQDYTRRLRPLIPELVETFSALVQDVGDILPLPKEYDQYDILDFCSKFELLSEMEISLEMLAEKGNFRTKQFRDWILIKFITVIKNIYYIHSDHIMLPIMHKYNKLCKPIERKAVVQPYVECDIDVSTLRIKVPLST